VTVSLVEELLPVYDVDDGVALVVEAPIGPTWEALLDADLIEVGKRKPMVATLGALRALPEIVGQVLHGERPERPPERMTLRTLGEIPLGEGGWRQLGLRERDEIALGLIGKFWRPAIEFASFEAGEFSSFAEPGFAKTIYALGVEALGEDRTLLTGTMRTATTDEHARRWFRRYWTFGVGSGAHLLVSGLLDVVREDAEARSVAG
jgi:hypothetical protein